MSDESGSDYDEWEDEPCKIVIYIHEFLDVMGGARFEADVDMYGHTFQSLRNYLAAYKTMAPEGSKINLSLIRSMFIRTRTPLVQMLREEHKVKLTKELYEKAEACMHERMDPEEYEDEDLWNEAAGKCRREEIDGKVYLVRMEHGDDACSDMDIDFESEDSEVDG